MLLDKHIITDTFEYFNSNQEVFQADRLTISKIYFYRGEIHKCFITLTIEHKFAQ